MTYSIKKLKSSAGMTMIELIVAVAAGALVILGVYRLLTTTLWSFNLQEQETDMTQNATYTIKRLCEVLEQAGASLPEKNYDVIYYVSGNPDSISMKVNKKNGEFVFNRVDPTWDTTTTSLYCDSAKNFIGATELVKRDTSENVTTVGVTGADTTSIPKRINLGASTVIHRFDIIYAAANTRYFLSGTNFCCDTSSNVLAENIDSLALIFYDATHAATSTWANMKSVALYVRARTASPDSKYTNPTFHDHYRRLALTVEIRLRNRF